MKWLVTIGTKSYPECHPAMAIASVIPPKLARGFHHRVRFLGAPGPMAIAACFFQQHGGDASRDVETYPLRTPDRLPLDCGCYGLSYILEGNGVFVDRAKRRIPVAAGDILQFSIASVEDKGKPHLEVAGRLLECGIHFSSDLGRRLEEAGIWDPDLQRIEKVLDPSIADRYVRFYDRLGDQALSSGAIVREAVALIDAIYARSEPRADLGSFSVKACRLLSDHLDPSYSVTKIADEMGLSYGAFRHKFTKHMGIPPNAYQLQQRINSACGLLDRFTVKEVSFKLGYKNESAFSKQFKKVVGQSPSEFRRRIAGK
jgi:AraC-like DNA-binding protein